MDVIDEGKAARHVAVTSESLSQQIVFASHDKLWVNEYCNLGQKSAFFQFQKHPKRQNIFRDPS